MAKKSGVLFSSTKIKSQKKTTLRCARGGFEWLNYLSNSFAFLAAMRSCLVSVRRAAVEIVMRTYFPVFGSKTFFRIRFGKNRRRVARLECERRFPEPGPFPVI